ncbi:hypothetical protein LV457_14475 [Mycobacterium sp. MYCO198283]|uniref:hypothetical protein n=1 Tax=Mycobacterium sp. MYCO198283 TaxID=2883505 RepID=UPI001E4373A9|nr:hypothetical protein [Mycobacterium sp. MYCO198283]MCG5433483.1 hypothetical protein [Mycobacterium sp. MYCO198283]
MNIVTSIGKRVTDAVGQVVDRASSSGGSQTVTIGRPPEAVAQLWRDPQQLSRLLGEIGEVTQDGDTYRWTLGDDATSWETRLQVEGDRLRFVGDNATELTVTLRPAPNQLGTEVTLTPKTPLPDLVTGAVAFTMLYRARALLQTGEIPTIRQNPSGRASAR